MGVIGKTILRVEFCLTFFMIMFESIVRCDEKDVMSYLVVVLPFIYISQNIVIKCLVLYDCLDG